MALATSTADGASRRSGSCCCEDSTSGASSSTPTDAAARAGDLAANSRAALAFRWWTLERQVRVAGPVAPVASGGVGRLFQDPAPRRPAGAWASDQSQPLDEPGRARTPAQAVAARFAGQEVPRPPWWGGFRVAARPRSSSGRAARSPARPVALPSERTLEHRAQSVTRGSNHPSRGAWCGPRHGARVSSARGRGPSRQTRAARHGQNWRMSDESPSLEVDLETSRPPTPRERRSSTCATLTSTWLPTCPGRC